MEAPSDREGLYSVFTFGARPAGEVGARRWDFCGVVGWEDDASGLVATCGVADLAGKADCNIEREILRKSTECLSVSSHWEKRKCEWDTYFCKLGGFSAAVALALQARAPNG